MKAIQLNRYWLQGRSLHGWLLCPLYLCYWEDFKGWASQILIHLGFQRDRVHLELQLEMNGPVDQWRDLVSWWIRLGDAWQESKAGEHQDIAWNLLIVAITQLTKHLWDSEHPEWSQGDRMCWRTVCQHFEPLEEFLLAHLHVKTYLSKFLLLWFKVSEISLPLYLVTLDMTEVSQLKVI